MNEIWNTITLVFHSCTQRSNTVLNMWFPSSKRQTIKGVWKTSPPSFQCPEFCMFLILLFFFLSRLEKY